MRSQRLSWHGSTRIGLVVTAVGTLAAAVALLHPFRASPLMDSPAHVPFGASLPSTKAGQSYSFGTLPLCLVRRGRAMVTDVEPVRPHGGLRVVDFAVRPLTADLFGSAASSLPATGFGGGRVVDELCDGKPGGAELAIELTKTGSGNARMSGVLIRYRANGRAGSVLIPFTVVLCAAANQDVPECRA